MRSISSSNNMTSTPLNLTSNQLVNSFLRLADKIFILVLVAIMMAVVIGKHYHSQMYYMERSRYRRDAKGIRLGDLSSQMGNKAMNIGPGVFLAATSGILTLVAGGMMLCQSCGKSEDEYDCHYAQSTESIVNNKRKEYI